LFWRAADGTGSEERLTTSANRQIPWSISQDGRTLLFFETDPVRGDDIWLLPLQAPRRPRMLLGTPFGELRPAVSRDGRWVAYESNLSGAFEVYLTSIAGGGRQIPVSTGGGRQPIWSRDGRDLHYRTAAAESAAGDMMAVSIDATGPQPVIGTPRVLFPSRYQGEGDIAPDGRFLLLRPTPQASPSRVINLVLNWFEDLQAKAPYPR
jgi:serine/threonine-protein kinase